MYAYFDDTKRFWWYLLGIYCASFFVYALLRCIHIPVWLSVSLVLFLEVCLILLVVNLTISKANAHMQEILNILFKDCDPLLFEQRICELLKKPVKNQTQRCLLTYYHAIATSVTQGPEAGYRLLSEKTKGYEQLHRDTQFLILHLKTHLLITLKRIDDANDCFSIWKEIEISKSTYPYHFDAMKQDVALRLQYARGELQSHTYITYLKNLIQDPQTELFYKVLLYQRLWEMMKRNHQDKERILCAYFIRQHGNTMACVENAKKDLEESI